MITKEKYLIYLKVAHVYGVVRKVVIVEGFTFLLAVHGTMDTAFTAISIDYISI